MDYIQTDWKELLLKLYEPHAESIDTFLKDEIIKYNILPKPELVFNAFNHFTFNELKVVLVCQDPYPQKENAMGLCFSVPNNVKCAASLRNIFKELDFEYNFKRTSTDLSDWASQGVLMLNTALTVREGTAGSHLKVWKPFSLDIIKYIANNQSNIVYILWGNYAKEFEYLIDKNNNLILSGIHPSPLAARSGSFVGCGHFKKTNDYLRTFEKSEIKWI